MQKLLGDKLYVFDLTPYEITQQTEDASVIYVQNECIDGYKELNVSLADKIEGFNQFVLCITDPWKEGVEPAPVQTVVLTAPYDLSIFDEAANGWVVMTQDSEDPTLEKGDVEYGKTYSVEQRSGIGASATVNMDPNYLTGEQGIVGAAFTIPNDGTATNCTITLTPKQDPELAWSANSATVNMVSPEGVPTLTNPHNVDVTYSSSDTDVAYFTPENGDIPLLAGNGNATISAIFAGNETYNASTVSYDLTVEGGSGESGSSDDQ